MYFYLKEPNAGKDSIIIIQFHVTDEKNIQVLYGNGYSLPHANGRLAEARSGGIRA